jgi:hypothetical protein
LPLGIALDLAHLPSDWFALEPVSPHNRPAEPVGFALLVGGRYAIWYAQGAENVAAAEAYWPRLAFAPALFATAAHGQTQPGGDALHWFGLSDQLTGELVGCWLLFADPSDATHVLSPGRAPFGGPQLAETLPLAAVEAFIAHSLSTLAARGFRFMSQTLLPTAYAPLMSTRVAAVLLAHGHQVNAVQTTLTHGLLVGEQSFEVAIKPSAQRRLKRLRALGYTWQTEPATELPSMLADLTRWRAERGHVTSLHADGLAALLASFPAHFPLFSVRGPNGERAAVTVAVWTTPTALYYFLPASDPALATQSPAILMIAGMHAFCRAAGGTLLDLGPSLTTDGTLHPSLLHFKRSLGATPSVRLSLSGAVN